MSMWFSHVRIGQFQGFNSNIFPTSILVIFIRELPHSLDENTVTIHAEEARSLDLD